MEVTFNTYLTVTSYIKFDQNGFGANTVLSMAKGYICENENILNIVVYDLDGSIFGAVNHEYRNKKNNK
jgi:hypothetical protein